MKKFLLCFLPGIFVPVSLLSGGDIISTQPFTDSGNGYSLWSGRPAVGQVFTAPGQSNEKAILNQWSLRIQPNLDSSFYGVLAKWDGTEPTTTLWTSAHFTFTSTAFQTVNFSLDPVELDSLTEYVFYLIRISGTTTIATSANNYSGGYMVASNGSVFSNYATRDHPFDAEFSVIPEPGFYAALMIFIILGWSVWKKGHLRIRH